MDIKESLARILKQESKVTDAFYAVFLDRCPEARPYFQATDMGRQSMNLSVALLVVECYFQGPRLRPPNSTCIIRAPGTITGGCRWNSIQSSWTRCS